MTKRKKKILLIQLIIFTVAILLLYFTYYNKNERADLLNITEEYVLKSKVSKKIIEDKKKLEEIISKNDIDESEKDWLSKNNIDGSEKDWLYEKFQEYEVKDSDVVELREEINKKLENSINSDNKNSSISVSENYKVLEDKKKLEEIISKNDIDESEKDWLSKNNIDGSEKDWLYEKFQEYEVKDSDVVELREEIEKKIETAKKNPSTNSFENVTYKGIDLNGNRYVINSENANFEIENPELINMKIMNAIFYFKDGTILKVKGDYGTYNNQTYDMEFRGNIIAEYEENYLFADNLDFYNSKYSLTIYGNVKTESIKGNIVADNLEFDLATKTLDISMFSNDQVNVKLRDK